MAKNISKNQWFKDIIDDVYLYTVAINNVLFIGVRPVTGIPDGATIATLRNPNLINFQNNSIVSPTTGGTNLELTVTGELKCNNILIRGTPYIMAPLVDKQLETDFYTHEQLAEMYPDNPAYQLTPVELLPNEEAENPVVTEVKENDESS